MIRGAVIHFSSEQPLVCDLRALPTAADACILITNLRFVDGRRPTFIDHVDSWFLYPIAGFRFIEIPADALAGSDDLPALPSGEIRPPSDVEPDEFEDVEDPDEMRAADDLLRRMREA